MTPRDEVIAMAKEAGMSIAMPEEDGMCAILNTVSLPDLERFAALVEAKTKEAAKLAELERICKAIKEEDDYCVTEGDYMLDSEDCIKVAKGTWVRPIYEVTAIRRGEGTPK